ncbi:MAG: hypothetical protein ACOZCF_02145 [Bacillota bacterium]
MKKYLMWACLAIALAVLWFFRTWFHTPVMFFYTRPEILQGVLFTFLLSRFVLPRWRFLSRQRQFTATYSNMGQVFKKTYHFRLLRMGAILLGLFILPAFFVFASWGRATYLSQTLSYNKVNRLPDSTQLIRLMPYEVAYRYAKDSLQLSQYKLGTEGMVLADGRLTWVFPLTPDGLVITFLNQNTGVVLIDATTQEKNSRMVRRTLRVGEGMQITDNLWWNIYRKRYFVTTEDPYYLVTSDDIYTVVPAIKYQFRLYWGVIHTVPQFAGLFLVDSDGNVSFLSPEEAIEHPVTAGNRIFPELLARQYVNAYQYRLGVLNKLFIHRDQIQIQDVKSPIQLNRQPFLVMTTEGPMWFVGTEPYGESHGIFKIFLVNAVNGEISLFELPEDDTLTGPVRAADYVRRANPIVDWSRFHLVEPLPLIRNGSLYWKLAVIPEDAAGIAYQAFVDSRTNEVYEARTGTEVAAFLMGKPVESVPAVGSDAQEDVIEEIMKRLREIEDLLRRLQ